MEAISRSEQEAARRLRRPYFDPIRIEGNTIISCLLEALPFVNGNLLDEGCGEGPYAQLLRGRACSYVGTDLRPSPKNPPTVCADSLSLPFKSSSFDTIVSTQVLEHVSNPFKMMEETSRVLRPGGHVILTMPATWPLHEEPYDFFRYTKHGLAELAKVNGLEVVKVLEKGGWIAAVGQLAAAFAYDTFGGHWATRLPMKLLVAPFLSVCEILDRLFYNPKFTLGYLIVARKPG